MEELKVGTGREEGKNWLSQSGPTLDSRPRLLSTYPVFGSWVLRDESTTIPVPRQLPVGKTASVTQRCHLCYVETERKSHPGQESGREGVGASG